MTGNTDSSQTSTKPRKVLTVEQHNSSINSKIRKKMEDIVALKAELKQVSPVKQATLAECNALSKVSLKPQAPAIKLKHPEVVAGTSNHLEL